MPASFRLLGLHLGLAWSALALLALFPPADGAVLLVPVAGGDGGAALRVGVAAGATLVGAGPWTGTVVMRGRRAALAGPLARAGVLLLAAPPGGCGAGQPGGAA